MRKQWLAAVCTLTAVSLWTPAPAWAHAAPPTTVYQPISFDLAATSSAATKDTDAEASATEGQRFELSPEETAALRMKKARAEARKWEFAYLTLSAVDAVQTISCLKKERCQEGNPLFGKKPSAKTIIATKLGMGIAHYALFSYVNKRDPRQARLGAQISAGLQGAVVMWNATMLFK